MSRDTLSKQLEVFNVGSSGKKLYEQNIVILEVDSSDNKEPLSTRVLSIKDTNQWNSSDRSKVLELIVTQCFTLAQRIF